METNAFRIGVGDIKYDDTKGDLSIEEQHGRYIVENDQYKCLVVSKSSLVEGGCAAEIGERKRMTVTWKELVPC